MMWIIAMTFWVTLINSQPTNGMENPDILGRAAIIDEDGTKRWPGGRVPYELSDVYSEYQTKTIKDALEMLEKDTCIRFVARTPNDEDYIHFYSGAGCGGSVGLIGGKQDLSLAKSGCLYANTIVHEVMHALGFYHEHTRQDRDKYIEIKWENIKKGLEYLYKIEEHAPTKVAYDMESVMHFPSSWFSVNGQKTIVARPGYDGTNMGNTKGLSQGDVEKINELYCKTEPFNPEPLEKKDLNEICETLNSKCVGKNELLDNVKCRDTGYKKRNSDGNKEPVLKCWCEEGYAEHKRNCVAVDTLNLGKSCKKHNIGKQCKDKNSVCSDTKYPTCRCQPPYKRQNKECTT